VLKIARVLAQFNDFTPQMTASHEMGHCFGLAHTTPSPSIMLQGFTFYDAPQPFDHQEINRLYP
jgi:predicted Zn-dependent protease